MERASTFPAIVTAAGAHVMYPYITYEWRAVFTAVNLDQCQLSVFVHEAKGGEIIDSVVCTCNDDRQWQYRIDTGAVNWQAWERRLAAMQFADALSRAIDREGWKKQEPGRLALYAEAAAAVETLNEYSDRKYVYSDSPGNWQSTDVNGENRKHHYHRSVIAGASSQMAYMKPGTSMIAIDIEAVLELA